MVLYWDQAGYFLEASSNSLSDWNPLPIPITTNAVTVDIDLHKNMFYRLVRP